MRFRGLCLWAALLLAGCTVGPDYKRPELSIPNDFRGRTPDSPAGAESLGDVAWWQIFQDETLQSLIRTALAENYDRIADLELRTAWRMLQPPRGAGRLLWACEQMATPAHAAQAVPRLWAAARHELTVRPEPGRVEDGGVVDRPRRTS